jgi:hypothetical protein
MISAAIPVAGFALSSMAKAITSLYQVTGEINTWVDKHLQDMQASDNLTVSRTGKVLEGAKFGFGIGFIAPIGIIAVGQFLLGHPLNAAVTIATGSNPLSMTCAAIGAIYFGWNALSNDERQDALDKLSKGLEIGIELIKSLIHYVICGVKDLLDPKHLEALKDFIKVSAESFGNKLSDITRTFSDKTKDMIAVGSENAKEAITKATEVAGDVVERAKSNAKDAFEFVSEKVDDIQQGMKKENVSHTKSLEHDKK